jgi:aspartate aminotransferase-like enzyme
MLLMNPGPVTLTERVRNSLSFSTCRTKRARVWSSCTTLIPRNGAPC